MAPVITSAKSVFATEGSVFSYQTSALNSPVRYGAQGLPAGLSINTTTGAISGKPTVAGTSSVTLSASNSAGTGTATLTLGIVPKSSFVQSVSIAASGTVKSSAVSFANNALAGDVILIGFDFEKASAPLSVTDSQGNTFTQVGSRLTSPGGAGSVIYLAKNIKGGADTVSVNLTANSSWLEVYVTEYSGVNQANPVDAQSGATGSAGPVSSGKSTTTAAGDIVYGYCVGDWACTVGSGFAARSTLNNNLVESEIAGNPGAYAATGSANNGWAMHMVALRPATTATASAVSLSPGNLTFSNQVVGSASAAQTITVSNSGNAALSLAGIAVTGANGGDFAQTSSCGSSVGVGASCTVGVTFKPSATGSRTAVVTLSDNAAGSPQSVDLSGAGVSVGGNLSATASLSSSSLNFGNDPVGVASASQVVTLTNAGGAALNISSIAFAGSNVSDFTQVNTCGTSVAAGGQCTIVVLFTPSALGARAAFLAVTDNAGGSPQSVSLTGNGGHDVILNWSSSASSGVIGYNVYRGTTSGGESSTPLNSAPVNGTSFTDVSVTAGAKYYYTVTAVASNGSTQSAASSQTSVTVPSS